MKITVLFVVTALLTSCSWKNKIIKDESLTLPETSLQSTERINDSSKDEKLASSKIILQSTENKDATSASIDTDELQKYDCVFDTSIFKFTKEALLKYNPQIQFHWNTKEKEAIVKMENNDSLFLHIGGCSHFSYLAKYRTDASKFSDEAYLLEKTRWLAKTFFDMGFENFDKYIKEKRYNLVSKGVNFKTYSIDTNPELTLENEVYEGFSFRKENGRTEIWIHGYIN